MHLEKTVHKEFNVADLILLLMIEILHDLMQTSYTKSIGFC